MDRTAGSGTENRDRALAVTRAVADFRAGIDRAKSFKLLHDRFYKPVRNVFHGLPAEDALDLTQETFLALYRGLDGFRGDSELSTWLFRIAKNKRYHWFRRPGAHEADDRSSPADASVARDDHQPVVVEARQSPEERAQLEENLRLLREAIATLPEQMQNCLRYRVYEDFKYQEIADRMEIEVNTVKAHLFQARKKLRELLGKRFGGLDF